MEPKYDITGTPLAELAKNRFELNKGNIGGAVTRSGVIESSNIASPYYTSPQPVAAISTERAKSVLKEAEAGQTVDMERLSTTEKNKQINQENLRKRAEDSARRQGGRTIEEIEALGGNTADYNYVESAGLYIPKQTSETPTFDQELDEIEEVFNAQQQFIDQSTANVMSAISRIYQARRKEQEDFNKRNLASYSTFGIRGGTTRYAGEIQKGILNTEERAGLERLDKIAAMEATAIAEAENARANKSYQLFVQKRGEVSKLKTERQKILTELQKTAQEEREEQRKRIVQASRDAAIADILRQGISTPEEILNTLNFDEAGNQVGDFSAKEVSDTLKNLSPGGDLKLLSGSVRDFYVLRGLGELPSDIASLPEEEQLFTYLKQRKAAETQPKSSTATGGKKITYTETVKKGLPISTVGMTEADVAQSFLEITPPPWFIEKYKAEFTGTLDNEAMKKTWDSYRTLFIQGKTTDESYRKPPPKIIGEVRALKAKGASQTEIDDYISFSGYDPNDGAFK